MQLVYLTLVSLLIITDCKSFTAHPLESRRSNPFSLNRVFSEQEGRGPPPTTQIGGPPNGVGGGAGVVDVVVDDDDTATTGTCATTRKRLSPIRLTVLRVT